MAKKTGDAAFDALLARGEELSKERMGAITAKDGATKRVCKLEKEMADIQESVELFHFDVLKRYTTLLNYRKLINERCEELDTELKEINEEITGYINEHGLKIEDFYDITDVGSETKK